MKSINRQKVQSLLRMAEISKPPIDVNRIAEELGFTVVPYPFPEKRKGMIHIEGGDKVIGVNENHPKNMQRFTIAHEIGHYLSGHQHYENTFIDDEKRYFDPHFHQEKEADIFAAELLMPKDWLIKDVEKYGLDTPKLAEIYEVSEQAMWIRLTSSGLAKKHSAR